jgi:hypothetical protein
LALNIDAQQRLPRQRDHGFHDVHCLRLAVRISAPRRSHGSEREATRLRRSSRRIATRFRAGYEILFTRQLTPEPEFEVNAHGRSDPVRRDAQLCLHLLRGTPAIFDRPWVAGTRI